MFKVGDVVRCIDDADVRGFLVKYNLYTVRTVTFKCITIEENTDLNYTFFLSDRFELVKNVNKLKKLIRE